MERRVDGPLDLAIALGRNVSLPAALSDKIDDRLGVVAAIRD